ncbi:MAG: hypothetical protein CMQ43_02805 [Gammaproteobacteria bacterium]|nr:hypothetical protein [Gammaproteobacteria bacterium]
MRRFEGVRCLVTGAADGIGRATARRLVDEGARVLACDIDETGLRDLPEAATLVLDVAASDAGAVAAEAIARHLGGLDVLVNNAGIADGAPLADLTDALWRRVMAVNLDSVLRLSRACAPLLVTAAQERGRGRIVNVGSVMSERAATGMAAYTASKHAVAGLSKVLALELGGCGVTVNYVQPGAIVTGITRHVFEADHTFRDFWIGKAALGRLGRPEDVAAAIAFLASPDADFVTGHGLVVDGGAMQSP